MSENASPSSGCQRVTFVIPARAGSKGLDNKNLRTINGKTLIEFAIQAAFDSDYEGNVMVSSDIPMAREICIASGVQFHQRSKLASSDTATASSVIFDILDTHPVKFDDLIVYLQPTSPLRSGLHVRTAIDLYTAHASPVVSVGPVKTHPGKMVKVGTDGRLEAYSPQFTPTENRQSLETLYSPNGAIYVFSVGEFLSYGDFPILHSIPLHMDEQSSLDIDTHSDLLLARMVLGGECDA